jgi:hypothetical protein
MTLNHSSLKVVWHRLLKGDADGPAIIIQTAFHMFLGHRSSSHMVLQHTSSAQVALSVEQHLFDTCAGELKLGCFR